MTEPETPPQPHRASPGPASEKPSSAAPPVSQHEHHALQTALTGVAGVLLGGLVLGKRGGLLAGLLGVGVQLLNQHHKAQAEKNSTVRPVVSEPEESTFSEPEVAPELEAEIEPLVSREAETGPPSLSEGPRLEEARLPEEKPEPEPALEETPPEAAARPFVAPAIIPVLPAPLAEMPEMMELPPVIPEAKPAPEAAATPVAEDTSLDQQLETALDQEEQFRNFRALESPEDSVAFAPLPGQPEAAEPAAFEPIVPAAEEPFVQWPTAESKEVEPSPPPAAEPTAFQAYVASMFKELETEPEPEHPAAPPAHFEPSFPALPIEKVEMAPPPVESHLLSEFDWEPKSPEPQQEPLSLQLPVHEFPPIPPSPSPPAIPTIPHLPPIPLAVDIPQLTPEDIWKLAAAEDSPPAERPHEADLSQPYEEPPTLSPDALAALFQSMVDEPPVPLIPESEPEKPRFSAAIAPSIPIAPPLPPPIPVAPRPPEIPIATTLPPFVELFGTEPDPEPEPEPEQAQFPQPAPGPFSVPASPMYATEPAGLSLFDEAMGRSRHRPLLTPEEELALENQPPRALPPPVVFEKPAAQVLPLPPPRENRPPERREGLRLFLVLLLMVLLALGYVFRQPLQKKWEALVAWIANYSHREKPLPSSTKPAPLPAAKPDEPKAPIVSPVPMTLPKTEPNPVPEPTPVPEPPAEGIPPTPPPAEPAQPPPPPPVKEIRRAASLPDLPTTPEAEPGAGAIPSLLQPEEHAQKLAETAVDRVLKADTVDDVLKGVLHSDSLAPQIKDYYARNPVSPLAYDGLVMDSSSRIPATNNRAFLFRVRTPDRPQGFPICVEETADGYRVEWEAYIQCRSRAAGTFWKAQDAEPKSLFVVLKRSHYFDNDIPNLDDYDCFTVSSPNPDEESMTAFTRKDSPFSRKFSAQLKWDASYFTVARFAHIKRKTEPHHVEITDIERFNWRNPAK